MSRTSIELRSLFLGVLVGQGVVTAWTGRPLRTFSVEFRGQWSMDADVLLLDETVRYADGRLLQRNWTVEFDARGHIHGFDAHRSSRLRARPVGEAVRLIYDRPLGAGAEIAAPRVVMNLTQTEDGALLMNGGVQLLGLMLQRTKVELRRSSDPVSAGNDLSRAALAPSQTLASGRYKAKLGVRFNLGPTTG
ncbi:MAG TPA: DUF3833 family protein [Caulobacteraceae bacterium]|jgi:hypothetical protein